MDVANFSALRAWWSAVLPIWALSSNGAENLHKEVTARRPGQRFSDRVAGLGFGYGRGKAQPVGDAEGGNVFRGHFAGAKMDVAHGLTP